MKKGLIQVYTGNGKGKTTAAFGAALRAIGEDLKVCIIQFMKSEHPETGEIKASQFLKDNLSVYRYGGNFISATPGFKSEEEIKTSAQNALAKVSEVIKDDFDMVILDEINVALSLNLINLDEVLDILRNKPSGLEIILTGRNAPDEIIEIADLVTEMKEVKHPFKKGIAARKGIEF